MKNNTFTTKIYDILVPDSNTIFLVLEYMETDLKKIFASVGELNFSENHMLIILYNLLCALNFMHSANVMHRDIKPANILIDANCGVKICDFGLART